MRLFPKSSGLRSISRRRAGFRTAVSQSIEALESRCLMDATGETATQIQPMLADLTTPANNSVDLTQYFSDSTLPGTLVTFNTSLGTIDVGLTDKATPLTVANFLSYVTSGAYNGTFFHRSTLLENDANGNPQTPSATTPADIVQAGGYNISNGSLNQIPTNAPVQDEYTKESFGDIAGTLAMAKTSDANTATDEFYFNENDNTKALDTPTTDSNGVTTSYTVFGTVLGSGSLSVIKAIASLPIANLGGALTTLPVSGLTQAEIDAGSQPTLNDLVYINSVASEPGTSYTVTSDVPTLVTPTVSSGTLSLAFTAGQVGTADITVKASNLDGTTASITFPVTVPDPAQPTSGPVVQPSTSSPIPTGVQGQIHALATATDSVAPLTLGGVTIVTQGTHGVATVDATTGYINYTSTAGFVGNDTVSYTVTDAEGNISSPATVTVDVVPGPAKVTIGTIAAKSLTFTEPDGAVGHLTVTGGTAVVTFTDFDVTTKTASGVVTATGSGAIITDVTITNFRGDAAALALSSVSPVTMGSVNDTGRVTNIIARNATIAGTCNIYSLGYLNVGATAGATLVTGGNGTRISIGVATNTSLQGYNFRQITSRQWVVNDGATHQIYANTIGDLSVSGGFAENVELASKGYDIEHATVAQASGNWNLSGSLFRADMTSPASSWALTVGGIVQQLNVKGTLSSVIQVAAISSLKVTGDANGAVLQTDATFSKHFLQIGRVSISGAATNSVIFAAGNIGSISVGSLSGTRIYAGVALATAQAGTLASAATDLSDDARIASVAVLGKGTSTFSSSQINADILGSLRLGDINTTASGAADGIAAHTISSVTATFGKTKLSLGPAQFRTTKTTTSAATLAAYLTKKGITLPDGDFVIDLY